LSDGAMLCPRGEYPGKCPTLKYTPGGSTVRATGRRARFVVPSTTIVIVVV